MSIEDSKRNVNLDKKKYRYDTVNDPHYDGSVHDCNNNIENYGSHNTGYYNHCNFNSGNFNIGHLKILSF